MLSYVWRFLFTEDDHEDEGAPAAEAQGAAVADEGGSDAETDGSSEDDEGAQSGDEDVCRGLTNGDTGDDEDSGQESDDEDEAPGEQESSDSEPDDEPPHVPDAEDATEYRCILSSGDLAVMRDFVDTIRAECIRLQISIGASHRAVLLSRCARDGIPCECPEPAGKLAEPDSQEPQGRDTTREPAVKLAEADSQEPPGDSMEPHKDTI